MELECPFDHGKCGFKTIEESEYADHTVQHKPTTQKMSGGLVKCRIAVAKDYAGSGKGKGHPVFVAGHMWADKPRDMDCGNMTFVIQDMGITDSDNYAGLSASTSGEIQRSKPYHNPFKRRA